MELSSGPDSAIIILEQIHRILNFYPIELMAVLFELDSLNFHQTINSGDNT